MRQPRKIRKQPPQLLGCPHEIQRRLAGLPGACPVLRKKTRVFCWATGTDLGTFARNSWTIVPNVRAVGPQFRTAFECLLRPKLAFPRAWWLSGQSSETPERPLGVSGRPPGDEGRCKDACQDPRRHHFDRPEVAPDRPPIALHRSESSRNRSSIPTNRPGLPSNCPEVGFGGIRIRQEFLSIRSNMEGSGTKRLAVASKTLKSAAKRLETASERTHTSYGGPVQA